MRRIAILTAVVLMFLGFGMAPAYAHYVYERQFTYESHYSCVIGRAEVSDGSGGGYAKADTTALYGGKLDATGGGWVTCLNYRNRNPGWIAVAWTIYRWNAPLGKNQACSGIGWTYNTSVVYKWEESWDYGTQPPCGAGYYETVGWSAVWDADGSGFLGWHGGAVYSGYHWLPA